MLTFPLLFIMYLKGWPNGCKCNHFKNQSKKQIVIPVEGSQLINVTLSLTSRFILPR